MTPPDAPIVEPTWVAAVSSVAEEPSALADLKTRTLVLKVPVAAAVTDRRTMFIVQSVAAKFPDSLPFVLKASPLVLSREPFGRTVELKVPADCSLVDAKGE